MLPLRLARILPSIELLDQPLNQIVYLWIGRVSLNVDHLDIVPIVRVNSHPNALHLDADPVLVLAAMPLQPSRAMRAFLFILLGLSLLGCLLLLLRGLLSQDRLLPGSLRLECQLL